MVVKIRSGVKPPPSCVIEQGTHEKPLWILYLYFAGAHSIVVFEGEIVDVDNRECIAPSGADM